MHQKTRPDKVQSLLLLSEKNPQACKNKNLTISIAKTADMTNSEHLYSWKHYRKHTNACKKDSQISVFELQLTMKKNSHWNDIHYKNIFKIIFNYVILFLHLLTKF